MTAYIVANEAQLDEAIGDIDAATSGSNTITFASTITDGTAASMSLSGGPPVDPGQL